MYDMSSITPQALSMFSAQPVFQQPSYALTTGSAAPQALSVLDAASLAPGSTSVSGLPTDFATQGGSGGLFGGMDTLKTANLAIAGLQTLGNLWGAWQAQKLAKEQFKWTKNFSEANLANSIKSYNTALYDRARSRGHMEGQSQAQIDGYVLDNSLTREVKSR